MEYISKIEIDRVTVENFLEEYFFGLTGKLSENVIMLIHFYVCAGMLQNGVFKGMFGLKTRDYFFVSFIIFFVFSLGGGIIIHFLLPPSCDVNSGVCPPLVFFQGGQEHFIILAFVVWVYQNFLFDIYFFGRVFNFFLNNFLSSLLLLIVDCLFLVDFFTMIVDDGFARGLNVFGLLFIGTLCGTGGGILLPFLMNHFLVFFNNKQFDVPKGGNKPKGEMKPRKIKQKSTVFHLVYDLDFFLCVMILNSMLYVFSKKGIFDLDKLIPMDEKKVAQILITVPFVLKLWGGSLYKSWCDWGEERKKAKKIQNKKKKQQKKKQKKQKKGNQKKGKKQKKND